MNQKLAKQLTISYEDGRSINELVKRIFEERPDIPDLVARFELKGGKTALFGAGDGASLTLIIGFESIDRDQLEIADYILEIAEAAGANVVVDLDEGAASERDSP